eukprot:comp15381_c0_seq1/m.12302 comp15381_c0_seq1/g.12302  ORF comp15381_c0_seq1/g.12302 comp15381_c0_seq1/m.12302 type:complete len:195 (-) comp15381_c0_seq1:234-818(-)
MSGKQLSSHDQQIFSMIFDPVLQEIPAMLFSDPPPESQTEHRELSEVEKKAAGFEILAIKEAEGGKLDEAVRLLNEAISIAPEYASPYNNRAQVRRLQKDLEGAVADLTKALELSRGVGPVAEKAYAQRALVYRLKREDDLARADYDKAAKMGNAFAKSELVAMNPYAQLCNQMLADVMKTLNQAGANPSNPPQ